MKGTILEKIISAKKGRVEKSKVNGLRHDAIEKPLPHVFYKAVSDRTRFNIIAEYKRASPSKGAINADISPADAAIQYQSAGAAAISVLTEEDHFDGSLSDLETVRSTVSLPILRKDFVIDEFQIRESSAAGADAVLLIVAALSEMQLREFRSQADELGMDVLVEVHDEAELETALGCGATLIGVNNRNLHTFEVSLNVSRRLAALASKDSILVSESGIKTLRDVTELSQLGYSAFLVGEALMSASEPGKALGQLIGPQLV